MRPVDSTGGHQGGPAVRGQARAAEVHAAKAEGRSPSRAHWREAAASTPAVEVTFSPEATAAAAETATTETATTETATTETAPAETATTETATADTASVDVTPVATEATTDSTSAAGIVAEALVGNVIEPAEPGMYVDVVA